MATITLTAGDLSSALQGYARSGSALASSFGSITAEPFAGFAVDYLYTSASGDYLALVGDTTGTFSETSFTVNGNAWALGSGTFASGVTEYPLTTSGGEFVNAVAYTIVTGGGGPSNPNITSASTVINLVNTTLAHTITADKTITSTAITGGSDAAAFEINGTTTLRFASNAASSALGPLVVDIEITDTDGLTDSQTITVPVKAILFKGSKSYSRAGSTSTATSSLTDLTNPLTGATGIAAAVGDTVVVIPAIGSTADRDMIISTGYTEQADHYSNGTSFDANIGLFTKTLASADTTVTFGSSGSTADAQGGIIMLFQGVDATAPMDVAVVLGNGTGTGKPDPAAITPVTTGAVGIFGGAQAAGTAVALTSSDLTAFRQVIQADTNDIAVGAGFIEWTSGAINPAAFGGGSSNAANSWATISAALRPAWTAGGSTGTASGTFPLTGAAAGTGAIAGTAGGTLPLTGSASGTVGSAITGSAAGTLSLSGSSSATAKITGSAAGSLPLTGSATGTARVAGNASGSLPLSGSASATVRITGSVGGLFGLSGSAIGTVRVVGAASGSLPLTGSATGTVTAAGSGSASGVLPLSGSATATVRIVGAASGSIALTGSATGAVRIVGAAGGSISLSGNATGAARVSGIASGAVPLSGSAAATARIVGVASGSLPLSGSASGIASEAITGSASGILPLAGAAVGTVRVRGTASGSLGLSGSSTALARNTASAAGSLPLTGSSSARLTVTGSAAGLLDLTGSADATVAVFGEASGDLPLTGSAAGMISTPVPIPAARIITLTAQRTVVTPDAVDTVIRPVALQTVLTPPAQPVILTPPHRCCVVILAGYEEVDMSSEYFTWPDKLAPAVIFYGVDWARRLGEATIVSHNFELVGGSVTLTPRTPDGTQTSVSIAGGAAGSVAVIIASVVASDGETHAIRVSIDIT